MRLRNWRANIGCCSRIMAVRCKSALSMASIFSEGQQCGFPRTATGAGHHIRDIKTDHFKYMTDQLRFLYSLRGKAGCLVECGLGRIKAHLELIGIEGGHVCPLLPLHMSEMQNISAGDDLLRPHPISRIRPPCPNRHRQSKYMEMFCRERPTCPRRMAKTRRAAQREYSAEMRRRKLRVDCRLYQNRVENSAEG